MKSYSHSTLNTKITIGYYGLVKYITSVGSISGFSMKIYYKTILVAQSVTFPPANIVAPMALNQ